MKIENSDKSSFAGTTDEQRTNDDIQHVCQPIAKPHVVRSRIRENLFTPDCIRTFTGIYVNVFEPTLEMICIEDIAHALSNQCRFGGHLPEFYSVAEHSCYCAQLVKDEHKLAALLHDASEAYLVDIPSPIKARLSNYKEIEEKLMHIISEKFGFGYPLHNDVKIADASALVAEWNCLMLGKETPFLVGLGNKKAKQQFFKTFELLQTGAA